MLAGARQIGPPGSIQPAIYETLFGLMVSTGLRVSEAIHLLDTDVNLKLGMLTIRQTRFAKSRQLPIHPTAVAALMKCRRQRARHVATMAEMPFLISSRGRRLGEPLCVRQIHRVFNMLRDSLFGYLTREEMRAVIGTPDESWISQRDHVLFLLMYNTGARVSEIGQRCGSR